jgi:hypothetical protein
VVVVGRQRDAAHREGCAAPVRVDRPVEPPALALREDDLGSVGDRGDDRPPPVAQEGLHPLPDPLLQRTYVPGRVTVRFRIERSGIVNGVQVEAPVILHRGGLTTCIKGVVGSLRFPASNMSQVITYPFSLI